jgi:predicted DCC family thiol-disulfide oxidoreductase YuxK
VRIDLQPKPIIYFDGVCNLCNNAVQFVLKNDKKKRFLFATLESDAGLNAVKQAKNGNRITESVILYYRGKYYTKSTAVLLTFKLLGGMWQILYPLILIPAFIRNAIYDLIGRNRYKWFGKKSTCPLPSAEIMERFVTK